LSFIFPKTYIIPNSINQKMLLAFSKQLSILIGRVLRESGQALDRVGCRLTRDVAYTEQYSRHRQMMPLNNFWPSAGRSFVAPSASLIGEVMVGSNCSILYGAVLRGDLNPIRIDDNVSIGENSSLQTVENLPYGVPNSLTIASNVFVAPHCSLTSCIIDSDAYLQTGSIVQAGARVEKGAVLLPGAVVAPGSTVSAYTVVGGSPAKFVREVNQKDVEEKENALKRAAEEAVRSQELLKSLGH
jgi:gamma-carbonic anhydrase